MIIKTDREIVDWKTKRNGGLKKTEKFKKLKY